MKPSLEKRHPLLGSVYGTAASLPSVFLGLFRGNKLEKNCRWGIGS